MSRRSDRSTGQASRDRQIAHIRATLADREAKLQRARSAHVKASHTAVITALKLDLSNLEGGNDKHNKGTDCYSQLLLC